MLHYIRSTRQLRPTVANRDLHRRIRVSAHGETQIRLDWGKEDATGGIGEFDQAIFINLEGSEQDRGEVSSTNPRYQLVLSCEQESKGISRQGISFESHGEVPSKRDSARDSRSVCECH